jgi:hypothetical protein
MAFLFARSNLRSARSQWDDSLGVSTSDWDRFSRDKYARFLGCLYSQFCLLDGYRPCGYFSVCHIAALTGGLAEAHYPGSRGHDGIFPHRGGVVSAHTFREDLGFLLSNPLPKPAGYMAQFPLAPLMGYDCYVYLSDRQFPFPLCGYDS